MAKVAKRAKLAACDARDGEERDAHPDEIHKRRRVCAPVDRVGNQKDSADQIQQLIRNRIAAQAIQ